MARYALLVGFDPDRARTYGMIASGEGLEAVAARGGAEAREILEKRGSPALVMTELSLTHADGFTLLGELRKSSPPETTAVLVVSGFPEFRDTAESMRDALGIADILSTAAPLEEVQAAVRKAVGSAAPATGEIRTGTRSEARPVVRLRASGAAVRDERVRLAQIAAMGLVDDAPPDEDLQTLVEEAARAFGVPIALVSIILEDKQWFKAHYGLAGEILESRSTPRDVSFCRHVVEGDTIQPLVVPDATLHPVFAKNPLVRSGVVKSYAGAPLVTPEGNVLGTLCIVGNKRLDIGPEQVDELQQYARRVAGQLDLKSKASRTAGSPADSAPVLEAVCSTMDEGVLIADASRRVTFANQAFADMFGLPLERAVGMVRDELLIALASRSDRPADFMRTMRSVPAGAVAAREELEIERPMRRLVRWVTRPLSLPGGAGQIDMFTDITASGTRAEMFLRTTDTLPG